VGGGGAEKKKNPADSLTRGKHREKSLQPETAGTSWGTQRTLNTRKQNTHSSRGAAREVEDTENAGESFSWGKTRCGGKKI